MFCIIVGVVDEDDDEVVEEDENDEEVDIDCGWGGLDCKFGFCSLFGCRVRVVTAVFVFVVHFSSSRRILEATFIDDLLVAGSFTFTLSSADDRGVVSHEEDDCELNTTELDDVSDEDDGEADGDAVDVDGVAKSFILNIVLD